MTTTEQTTTEQDTAILELVAVYDTDDCPCDGLASYDISDGTDADTFAELEAGQVEVQFHYFYDDGRSGTGLEVTIFNRDGSVASSQDFG